MAVVLDRSFFSNLSKSSKILGVVLILGYLTVGLGPKDGTVSFALNTLALVAGKTLPFRCWNVVTSAFVENSAASLIFLTLPVSLYVTHVLEPIQGQKALTKIILITAISSGTLTFITIWFLYVVGSMVSIENADVMASTVLYAPVCGFQGAVSGLLVTLKQAVPESDVRLAHVLKVKMTFVPIIYVLCVCCMAILRGHVLKYVPFTVFGWYTSWVYLRYFHLMPDSGLRGDPSDQFRFLSFFPEKIQKNDTLNALCTKFDALLIGWLQGIGFGQQQQRLGNEHGLDIGQNQDGHATRRRERGMKALEERIASTNHEENNV